MSGMRWSLQATGTSDHAFSLSSHATYDTCTSSAALVLFKIDLGVDCEGHGLFVWPNKFTQQNSIETMETD